MVGAYDTVIVTMEENGARVDYSSVGETGASIPAPAEAESTLGEGSSVGVDLQESEAEQILGATGDIRKVVVFNVGKHVNDRDFYRFLSSNKISYKHAKKSPKVHHAIMSFETVGERTQAMAVLSTLQAPRGGANRPLLKAVLSTGKGDRGRRMGDEEEEGEGAGSKRKRQEGDGSNNQDESRTVAQATASLYGVKTYEEQLAFKEEELKRELFLALPRLVRKDWEKRVGLWRRELKVKRAAEKTVEKRLARLPDVPPELLCPSWCKDFKSRNGVVPFEVLSIVPSPEQEGYRNKCEFTIARDKDHVPTTGFLAGRFRDRGKARCTESPDECPQVHKAMTTLCRKMDRFMGTSRYKPYEDETKTGVWRLLSVRRSVADDETMAKIVVNLRGISSDSVEWKAEQARLVTEFSQEVPGEEPSKLVSLWLQEYDGVSTPDDTHPLTLLWGKERLEEQLLDLKFSISPNSFFQTNTKGAEALFAAVIDNLELGEHVNVLDVCCGAGTIGICAAKAGNASKIYGSDICKQAIKDARRNAEANNLQNCDFQCGKAEDLLSVQVSDARTRWREHVTKAQLEASQTGGEKVEWTPCQFAAVVDPPRAGMHHKALRVIRDVKAIKRLVYVSCNPTKTLAQDAMLLCGPVSSKTRGMPFRPVKAIPVDMFPHTPHIETVMVFERIEYETAPDKSGKAAPAIPTGDDIVSTTSSASGVGTPIPAIEELPGIPSAPASS